MRYLVGLLVVLAPAVATADKSFSTGRGATWDCAKDPVVNINHGGGTYTFKGACKTLNVNGGKNRIVVDDVDTLNINGARNQATVGAIDAIHINGSGNKVTWKRAKSGDKPSVSAIGRDNTVVQAGGADAGGKPPAKDAPAKAPPPPPAAKGTVIDCAKKPTFAINTGGGTYTFTGTCERIAVNGGDNTLTIENVKRIGLNGGHNVVAIGGADAISIPGSDNTVSYKKGLSGAKPKIVSLGEHNSITQVK